MKRRHIEARALASPLFRHRVKPDKRKAQNKRFCRSKPQTNFTMSKNGGGSNRPFLLQKQYTNPNETAIAYRLTY